MTDDNLPEGWTPEMKEAVDLAHSHPANPPDLPPGLDLNEARDQKEAAGTTPATARDLVDQLADVKAQRAVIKKRDDQLDEQQKEVERLLRDMLDEQGSKSIKTDLGVSFSRNDKRHYSVLADDRDQFIEWLDEVGAGALAQRAVPGKTAMTKFCAEHVDNGGDLPPFVKVYETHKIRLTGINKLVGERTNESV